MAPLSQRFRPKHQVLILKCYPRAQSSTVEIKPNSSELSYLLYYASTRRSKLQKVGVFLEKKMTGDVHKLRQGNVQVTLQILTAIVEKCPRDLPLYVSFVLQILDTIVRTHDINLIEASLPTFTALCTNWDSATLSADQALTGKYDAIIQSYTSFAARSTPSKAPGRHASIPEAIRYRNIGLQAIKSLVSSNCFAADSGKHLRIIMPYILENLYSNNPGYLQLLRHREGKKEQQAKEQMELRRHRTSMSVTRASELTEGDPTVASGTAADVDKRADEEIGVLALQSLQQIFSADNRGQIRVATNAILGFTLSRRLPSDRTREPEEFGRERKTWSTELFEMVCRWVPVQDRYIILVSAMESLIRSPIVEDDLPDQLELTRIIGWLLRSNINFIGLSVMDVLVGMIQHILLLLQLGGGGSNLSPHHQQNLGVSSGPTSTTEPFGTTRQSLVMEVVAHASAARIELLAQLQHCVGDLATHVYYSDQISDMVGAILLRLKPSPMSAIRNPVAAVENPVATAEAIADSVNLHEKPHTDGFFSFDTARLLALKAVTEILVVANSHKKDHTGALGRNRVEVSTWEGTQWLLRDPDGRVRKAYVEALLTWLRLEIDKASLDLLEPQASPRSKRKDADTDGNRIAKRAVSNASTRSKTQIQTSARSFFLQLLHLAAYESALQYADSEPDILLLHLLLVNLVQKLGVNAVRTGLPMIFRLQEDVNTTPNASARISLGSLVHGYFWALSDTFDFEETNLGRHIHTEISRRSTGNLWLQSIRVPAVPLQNLGTPADASKHPQTAATTRAGPQLPQLHPLDARRAVIDAIANGYEKSTQAPPTSPLPSPGRSMSYAMNSPISVSIPHEDRSLPANIKDEMLSHWTREDCLASFTAHESAKAASFAPSRGSPRNYLSPHGNSTSHVNMTGLNAGGNTPSSGDGINRSNSLGRSSTHSAAFGGLQQAPISRQFIGQSIDPSSTQHQPRRTSGQSAFTPRSASSASRSIVHVADMKRALAGTQGPNTLSLTGFGPSQLYGVSDEYEAGDDSPIAGGEDQDRDSDSMVSVSASYVGDGSVVGEPIHAHGYNNGAAITHNAGTGPSSLPVPGAGNNRVSGSNLGRGASVRSRASTRFGGSTFGGMGSGGEAAPVDVLDLLKGIQEGEGRTVVISSGLSAPPY